MDTRLTASHGVWRLLLATVVALALLMAMGVASASSASPTACSVKNSDTGRTYTRLQQAVEAAKPGARLTVKGSCHGGTFIDKDLAIAGTTTKRTGKPVLTAGKKTRVLVIKQGVKVYIPDLTIRKGRATRVPNAVASATRAS